MTSMIVTGENINQGKMICFSREQGWRSVERALASTPRNVAGIRFSDSASFVFLRVLKFFPLLKNQHFQVHSGRRAASFIYSFIYFISHFFIFLKKENMFLQIDWNNRCHFNFKKNNVYLSCSVEDVA